MGRKLPAEVNFEKFASPLSRSTESSSLARFPLERNRSSDEKTRQIKKLERVLIAKAYLLLRNSL